MCTNVIESIKHVLWDCPRSARVWEYLNNKVRGVLGYNYITYNAIILGRNNPNMAMETMILWAVRSIMSIDRENMISNEVIEHKFKTLFYYEKQTFGSNTKKLISRWGNLVNIM
jgi:hypothetical protein